MGLNRVTIEVASSIEVKVKKLPPQKAKAQAVALDATALLTACGLALRSFD